MNKQNAADFSQGSIGSRIMAQAIPLSLAEIAQLLYNIVDRIFLGHLPDGNTLALTGVGLIFPVVSIVAAFTSLYSSGGAPIFAMARGRKDEERALQIQGHGVRPAARLVAGADGALLSASSGRCSFSSARARIRLSLRMRI